MRVDGVEDSGKAISVACLATAYDDADSIPAGPTPTCEVPGDVTDCNFLMTGKRLSGGIDFNCDVSRHRSFDVVTHLLFLGFDAAGHGGRFDAWR